MFQDLVDFDYACKFQVIRRVMDNLNHPHHGLQWAKILERCLDRKPCWEGVDSPRLVFERLVTLPLVEALEIESAEKFPILSKMRAGLSSDFCKFMLPSKSPALVGRELQVMSLRKLSGAREIFESVGGDGLAVIYLSEVIDFLSQLTGRDDLSPGYLFFVYSNVLQAPRTVLAGHSREGWSLVEYPILDGVTFGDVGYQVISRCKSLFCD